MAYNIPDNSTIQPGASAYFKNDDISALDGGYFNSPLPVSERTTIHDRHGRKVAESEETTRSGSGRNILAALDFSRPEHVETVMDQLIKLAKSDDTVILFNGFLKLEEIAELSKRVDSAARVLTHVVHGKPEATLLGVAEKHHVDLIILGKRKLKGLKKLTATSVSNHVIEQAPCSVLIAK